MEVPLWLTDWTKLLFMWSYRYFFRYFFVSEVGERWAMLNNLMGFFGLCVALIYITKVRRVFNHFLQIYVKLP